MLDNNHRFSRDTINRVANFTLAPYDDNCFSGDLFNELYSLALEVSLQLLSHPILSTSKVSVYCLRLDLIDPFITGNKYFKQAVYLQLAMQDKSKPLLSFGGPYSNHIHALAAAGARHNIQTIGIIRGLHQGPLSPTLEDAKRNGMKLKFVSRLDYSQKQETSYLQTLEHEFGPVHVVPEGGGGELGAWGAQAFALAGMSAMLKLGKAPRELVLASGTGASTAGVYAAINKLSLLQGDYSRNTTSKLSTLPIVSPAAVIKFKALSAEPKLYQRSIEDLSGKLLVAGGFSTSTKNRASNIKLSLNHDAHFGGYGKCPLELRSRILEFEKNNDIILDPVYTAKALFSFIDNIKNRDLIEGSSVLFFHTGGVQGRRGFSF